MEKTLFNPKRIDLPHNLLLTPQFWDKEYYGDLKQKAIFSFDLILSELLVFEKYALVSNFLGYPHIITILEFIQDVREKEIYFLGTAGSLCESLNQPIPLEVTKIFPSGILNHFSRESYLHMKPVLPSLGEHLTKAEGVTVDIIQRETPTWLEEQCRKNLKFVEMEIFPLRVYLEKPFSAIVVTSDLLKETGIKVFQDKQKLKHEFVQSFELFIKSIDLLH